MDYTPQRPLNKNINTQLKILLSGTRQQGSFGILPILDQEPLLKFTLFIQPARPSLILIFIITICEVPNNFPVRLISQLPNHNIILSTLNPTIIQDS